MKTFNITYFFLGLSVAFNIYSLYFNPYFKQTILEKGVEIKDTQIKDVEIKDSIEEFYKIARPFQTDKVTVHSYQYISLKSTCTSWSIIEIVLRNSDQK